MNCPGRPLDEHLPELASIPRVALLDAPTPLALCRDLGNRVGCPNLWIKRDDLSATPYGGNKPRKLEYGLGEIISRQAKCVVTVGGIGTNHGLATAIYCRQLGLGCHLVLFEQPVTDHVRENLRLFHRFGASLQYASSYLGVGWHTARFLASTWLGSAGRRVALLAPGGTSALTNLGFVNAALELHQQLRTLGTDPPSHVFCALGSGGTMAGLLVGFRLCGLPTEVVGVRVVDRIVANRYRIARLANRTLDLIKTHGARVSVPPFRPGEVTIMDGFFGDRYGAPTFEGQQAVKLAAQYGITLETTYTGKAFAALIQYARTAASSSGPVIFWNTYNSRDLCRKSTGGTSRDPQSGDPQSGDPQSGDPQSGDPQSGDPQSRDPQSRDSCSRDPRSPDSDWRELPAAFHRFFDDG